MRVGHSPHREGAVSMPARREPDGARGRGLPAPPAVTKAARARALLHRLGEPGRRASVEARVATVTRGDRVRADRERADREHRLARAVKGAGAEGARAVLEGHRAGRGARAGALRRHRRGESHRLPGHRRVGRGADRRGGAGLLHRLGERARSASGEGRVAAVGRGDRVRSDRERADREPRLAQAVQGAGAEGARAVLEGHRAASVLLVSLLSAGAARWAGVEEAVTLTFIWHAGDRAELLRKISEQYTRETGVRIAAILADCR